MLVYVARDSGTDRWLGVFPTLEAAQAAAEAWVLEWGVTVDRQRLRVDPNDIVGWLKGWNKSWNPAALVVYRLHLDNAVYGRGPEIPIAEVDVAVFDIEQPS